MPAKRRTPRRRRRGRGRVGGGEEGPRPREKAVAAKVLVASSVRRRKRISRYAANGNPQEDVAPTVVA